MTDEAHSLLTIATTPDEELLDLLAREVNFYHEVLRKRANRTILTAADIRELFHRMWDIAQVSTPPPPEPELHPDDVPESLNPCASYRLPHSPDLQKLETELGEASKGFLNLATRRRRRL